MIAKGGDRLLVEEAIATVKAELLRAGRWSSRPTSPKPRSWRKQRFESLDDMRAAAKRIRALGARVVVVKGGHLDGPASVDVVCTADRMFELTRPADSPDRTRTARAARLRRQLLQTWRWVTRSSWRSTRRGDIWKAPFGMLRASAGVMGRSITSGAVPLILLEMAGAFWSTHEPLDPGAIVKTSSPAAMARSRRSSGWCATTTPDDACDGSTTRRMRRWR